MKYLNIERISIAVFRINKIIEGLKLRIFFYFNSCGKLYITINLQIFILQVF